MSSLVAVDFKYHRFNVSFLIWWGELRALGIRYKLSPAEMTTHSTLSANCSTKPRTASSLKYNRSSSSPPLPSILRVVNILKACITCCCSYSIFFPLQSKFKVLHFIPPSNRNNFRLLGDNNLLDIVAKYSRCVSKGNGVLI